MNLVFVVVGIEGVHREPDDLPVGAHHERDASRLDRRLGDGESVRRDEPLLPLRHLQPDALVKFSRLTDSRNTDTPNYLPVKLAWRFSKNAETPSL